MRELKIAYGGSCHALKWSNKTILFDELCRRLETTIRTPESAEEYPRLPKNERDRIKDKGGYVGGWLRDGRRKRENVTCRSMLTHDADHAEQGFIDRYRQQNGSHPASTQRMDIPRTRHGCGSSRRSPAMSHRMNTSRCHG